MGIFVQGGLGLDDPSLVSAIDKLAIAGERAGFTVEQLIRLLNAGISVDALLRIIAQRLSAQDAQTSQQAVSADRNHQNPRLVN